MIYICKQVNSVWHAAMHKKANEKHVDHTSDAEDTVRL